MRMLGITAVLFCLPPLACQKQERGSSTSPTSQTAATQPSTAIAIRPHWIGARSTIYLARSERTYSVSDDGQLQVVHVHGKSFGPNDKVDERREVQAVQLTPAQMTLLGEMLRDWNDLSDQPYGGVPDGGDYEMRHAGKTVSGGSDTPRLVLRVLQVLDAWATEPRARANPS